MIFLLVISFNTFSQTKIRFKDLENVKHKLTKNSINIFVFLDTECPISQQYVRILETLRLEFSQKSIHFWAVFPTNGVTKEEIVAFHEKYNFQYPSIIDYYKKLTLRLDAKTTPEVFIVNHKGKTLYQGAVDNLYFDLGKKRPKASIFYLKNALNSIFEHQPITIKKTVAIGCDIER
jgi:AhpC/TSA family